MSLARASATVLLAVLLTAIAAPAARADHNDEFAKALPMQIGDNQTETTVSLGIETGEWMTAQSAGSCRGAYTAADAAATAWHDVVGNGRTLTFSAHSPEHGVLATVYRTLDFNALSSNVVACGYDETFGRRTVSVSWPSTPGARYRVQVGRCRELTLDGQYVADPNRCGTSPGTMHVSLTASAPGNDAMSAPLALGAGGEYDNVGATVGAGESPGCGAVSHGRTVWFSWQAPAKGDVVFLSSPLTTSLSPMTVGVYAGGSRVDCGQGAARASVQAGATYLVEVGGVGVGGGAQQGRFNLRPSFTQDYNVDDDPVPGPPAGNDCDDNDARRYPGARDVAENGIDEDCKNGDARFPVVRTDAEMYFVGSRGAVRIDRLMLRKVPRGARVVMHCRRGPGCRRGSRVLARSAKRSAIRVRARGYRVLRRGSVVEVDVTKRRTVGKRFRWGPRFTGKGVPRHTEHCLHPKRKRPYRC